MICEICHGELVGLTKKDEHTLYKCNKCGFMQFDYRFSNVYNERAAVKILAKTSKALISRAKYFSKYYIDKNVLDIGCGVARMQKAMDAARIRYKTYTNVDRRENLSDSYKVHPADVTKSFRHMLPVTKFDIAVVSHVLEHLPNPRKVLDLWKREFPGTLFYVEVPSYDNVNLDNSEWLVYEHISYFNKNSFDILMKDFFTEVESGYHGTNIYFIGSWKE